MTNENSETRDVDIPLKSAEAELRMKVLKHLEGKEMTLTYQLERGKFRLLLFVSGVESSGEIDDLKDAHDLLEECITYLTTWKNTIKHKIHKEVDRVTKPN